jgi:hypothetical protein
LSHFRGSHDRKSTEIIVSMGATPTITMTGTGDGTTEIVVRQNRMIKSAENVNISRFVRVHYRMGVQIVLGRKLSLDVDRRDVPTHAKDHALRDMRKVEVEGEL